MRARQASGEIDPGWLARCSVFVVRPSGGEVRRSARRDTLGQATSSPFTTGWWSTEKPSCGFSVNHQPVVGAEEVAWPQRIRAR